MTERGEHDFDVVRSEHVYDGAILSLRVDTVTMPGDSTARREIVEHPGAVAVVAVDEAGNVILVRQYRHAVGERLWELPAGLLDVDGEPPRDAAARELLEEAGVEATDWWELVHLVTSPGFSEERVQVFLAAGLKDAERPVAEHEEADMEITRVPAETAVEMVLDGRITNAIAVAGILASRVRHQPSG